MRLAYVCHTDSERAIRRHLIPSLELGTNDSMRWIQGHPSLCAAYAAADYHAINEPVDVVVYVHDDVVLLPGFRRRLVEGINKVARRDPNWGVIGVMGQRIEALDYEKRVAIGKAYGCGRWDTQKKLWRSGRLPTRVHSLDSALLVKRPGRVAFDPTVPSFHGPGEDISAQALLQRRGVWVVDAPTYHASNGQHDPVPYERCKSYLTHKYGRPIFTVTDYWPHPNFAGLAPLLRRAQQERW